MMKRSIYNLVFPSWCPELNIFGYHFIRVENYEYQLQKLQQRVNYSSEFNIKANTGQHAITAYVEIPSKEKASVLKWSGDKNTALMDILLLLSLFTGREVFAGGKNSELEDDGVIIRDPRVYQYGGSLITSIPHKKKMLDDGMEYNIGFEEGINQVYSLIKSKKWQEKYHQGYFLFLVRQAFHAQTLEASFIQCWTIWEHLFSILNQKWMSKKEIQGLSSTEKISFLLVEHALSSEVGEASRKRIVKLTEIRNRLVHFGMFPDRDKIHDDAILFIRLTEFLIAKILGLLPSNVFNTVENLEKYLH